MKSAQDVLIRRVGRNAVLLCVLAAIVAVPLGGYRAAAGVVGGGVLVGISFLAVAFTIGVFVGPPADPVTRGRARGKRAFAALIFIGHYALLALGAYVMIARLRLHPIGLLGGVTSIVAAIALEAGRPKKRR
jgi:hypothetical protein